MFHQKAKLSSQLTLLLILSPKKEAHVTKTNKQNNKWADVAWRLVGWAHYQEVGILKLLSELQCRQGEWLQVSTLITMNVDGSLSKTLNPSVVEQTSVKVSWLLFLECTRS